MAIRMIKMTCSSCGHEVEVPAFCPYTGMVHGEGWTVVCSECRGHLEVPEDDKTIDNDDSNDNFFYCLPFFTEQVYGKIN